LQLTEVKICLPYIVTCILTAALVMFALQTMSQPYYFRHYQVENGLSNNTVFCSAQDKNGFLWFGTKEGVNRFDGYHFKLFRLGKDDERTFSQELVYFLYSDKQGTLWVGAQKGLFRFDPESEQLLKFSDSLTEVGAIQEDVKGRLWFISNYTVCRYTPDTRELKIFPRSAYFDANTLCLSGEGDMWISTTDGYLQQYNETTGTFKRYNILPSTLAIASCSIKKMVPSGKHTLFIGTSCQGIKQFDISTGTCTDVLVHNPDQTAIYVRDILPYNDHEFWFATESGIFILKTDQPGITVNNLKKRFLDPYSLNDNAIYTLCKDNEGGVWAGTYFGGVNYYARQYAPFHKYYPDNTTGSVSGNAVREICDDQYGNIWIGTEDAGLNKVPPAAINITHFKPTGEPGSITYSNIHGLLADGNKLWIGTHEHGLDVLDIPSGKLKKHYDAGPGPKQMKNNFVVSMLHTSRNEILVGTGNSIFRYNAAVDGFEPYPAIPEYRFVSCMIEDHNKVIWASTHGVGVYSYNPATSEKMHFENEPDNKNSLTSNVINAVCEDSYGNIWLSTEGGGLCKIGTDRKTITRFTTRNNFPSNYIFKVVEDNYRQLWVSTSKGLVQFDPVKLTTTVYTKANGLLNDQFNYNSGFKDSTGRLYFGSVRGMITFRPEDFQQSHFTPPVYITGFQVHNKELVLNTDSTKPAKSISFADEITLSYDQSSFSIDFAALSFASPEMTAYSYKMEGLEKDRKAYFTNISPGKYTFLVKAATNGLGDSKEKQLVIRILPPFWATIWAYILYAACFIALAWYLISTYHKRVLAKKEKEIYEAKLDFFTNVAHEIKTPLTLIKGPVDNLLEKVDDMPDIKQDVLTMNRNTNRLINLISQVLDFRKTETRGFSLDFTKVNINALLEENYTNFQPLANKKGLTNTIELPPVTVHAMADEEALHKIFNNLFSNAIKYAEKEVTIRLIVPKDGDANYCIEISNDGFIIPADMSEKIFEPFYRLKETIKQKGTGIGLALARSLAELHKGTLHLKDSANGLNTFVLSLPLKNFYATTGTIG
jgi:signal transduction histidine kinase/ligand-binding sensor domain-containing protein